MPDLLDPAPATSPDPEALLNLLELAADLAEGGPIYAWLTGPAGRPGAATEATHAETTYLVWVGLTDKGIRSTKRTWLGTLKPAIWPRPDSPCWAYSLRRTCASKYRYRCGW